MIGNYLKIAWRNLWRNKTFSIINIVGLALGLVCSLLILLWVQHERSMDGFHANSTQLYAVYQREYADGKIDAGYTTSGMLAEELRKVVPGIRYASSYLGWTNSGLFQAGSKTLKENGSFAGTDFFRMFSFPLLQGRPDMALQAPGSIAISRKMALHFFETPEAAMGKALRFNDRQDLLVTAVFEDMPDNSSLRFDYLIDWHTFKETHPGVAQWSSVGCYTAIMLRRDADPGQVRARISKFLDAYYTNQGPGLRVELDMQRFDEQYLHGNFRNGQVSGGRIEYVRLFSIVAVFILLIAGINFMNLTTARSIKRSKEIGVRKAVGALRGALIRQFISEAMLLVFLAFGIALLLVILLLPQFNGLTGKYIILPVMQPVFWLQLLMLGIITGFVSGSYPAWYLSSFQPVKALRGALHFSKGATGFWKGLVIFQFALSILLISGTIIVSRQVHYIQTKNLGYDRENLIYIPMEGDLVKHCALFMQEALRLPGIKQVSQMTGSPVGIGNYDDGVQWQGKTPDFRPTFAVVFVGYDFTSTTGVQLSAGRDFSSRFPTDSTAFLINEAAARKMGYKNPIGKRLMLETGKAGPVIGVIKDFHNSSLHDPIDPMILGLGNEGWGSILVRTEAGRTQQALAGLEGLYKKLNPKFPFAYQFSDEEYLKLYKNEQVIKKLGNYFAFLAIFISCLGLLGLALFAAEQRTKEIGIRKVLGAGIGQLFILLSREFLLLVLIAFFIAGPLAWWLMNKWLEDYVYRIEISGWIFLTSGAIALLIAFVTVSSQTVRAALANPVKSLRAE